MKASTRHAVDHGNFDPNPSIPVTSQPCQEASPVGQHMTTKTGKMKRTTSTIIQRMFMMIQCRLPSSPSRHVALELVSSCTLHQHAQICPRVQGTGIAGAGSRGAGPKASSTAASKARAPGLGKGKGPQAQPAPAAGASALAQSLCSPPPRLPTGRQQQGGEGGAACLPACCLHHCMLNPSLLALCLLCHS